MCSQQVETYCSGRLGLFVELFPVLNTCILQCSCSIPARSHGVFEESEGLWLGQCALAIEGLVCRCCLPSFAISL